MRFNLLSKSSQVLITAVLALAPIAATHATDLYDSLKAWEKQGAEERKLRESQQTAPPSLQPESTSGAQGPIRSDMNDDRSLPQQTPSPSDESSRQPATPPSNEVGGQQIQNSPRMPSP